MKQFIKYFVVMVLTGILVKGYAAFTIGNEVYFTTGFGYSASNAVNVNSNPTWNGQNSSVYVGLYPTMSDKLIKGDARIYVNNTSSYYIYFGGARVTGMSEDKTIEATIFGMSPAFSMSDPMSTGAKYGSDVYTTSVSMAVKFANGSFKYPVIYSEKWMETYDYSLGGQRGVGLYSKINMINNMFTIEDYICWNMNNFDTYGAMLKFNTMDFNVVTVQAGALAEVLKYKSTQDFKSYNAYYYMDITKILPSQSAFKEDSYIAFGGYANIGVLGLVNVFGEYKITAEKGKTTAADAKNSIDGYDLFAGVYSEYLEDGAGIVQIDLGMSSGTPNTNIVKSRSSMIVSLKSYGAIALDEDMGLKISYLINGGYATLVDGVAALRQYENVSFPTANRFTNATIIDAKASVRFDALSMVSFREMLRYNQATFTTPGTYTYTGIESRTYIDLNLETLFYQLDLEFGKGLFLTGGVRFHSYQVSTNGTTGTFVVGNGTATYVTPYVEVKYLIGDFSYLRLSWGYGEVYNPLAVAYGFGYDSRVLNSGLSTYTDNATKYLYNNAEYNMDKNAAINLEVGMQL